MQLFLGVVTFTLSLAPKISENENVICPDARQDEKGEVINDRHLTIAEHAKEYKPHWETQRYNSHTKKSQDGCAEMDRHVQPYKQKRSNSKVRILTDCEEDLMVSQHRTCVQDLYIVRGCLFKQRKEFGADKIRILLFLTVHIHKMVAETSKGEAKPNNCAHDLTRRELRIEIPCPCLHSNDSLPHILF
jgi:hypothetical protein